MTSTVTVTAGTRMATARRTLGGGAALTTGLGVVVNAAVLLLADRGTPVRVVTGWRPGGAELRLVDVVGASLAWLLVATAGLWLFDHLGARGFRTWAIAAWAVALLSIVPVLGLDIDTRSKAVLATMHLVVAAAAVGGHLVARRPEAVATLHRDC